MGAKVNGQKPGSVMEMVVGPLEQAGYKVSYQLYDAKYFGAATSRDRVILMAVKDNIALPFLTPTHGINNVPFVTLGDVLSTLPKDLKHHHTQFTAKRLPFFKMLKAGQNWKSLSPEALIQAVPAGTRKSVGGKTGLFRRLAWDKPCPTLICLPTYNTTALCHPEEHRPLSVEEYKVIQGFPLDYIIKGSNITQYKQLGNCVPIKLGEAIGKVISQHMNGVKSTTHAYIQCSRYHCKPYVSTENIPSTRGFKRIKLYQQLEEANELACIANEMGNVKAEQAANHQALIIMNKMSDEELSEFINNH